jgi:hypothetical protein
VDEFKIIIEKLLRNWEPRILLGRKVLVVVSSLCVVRKVGTEP